MYVLKSRKYIIIDVIKSWLERLEPHSMYLGDKKCLQKSIIYKHL